MLFAAPILARPARVEDTAALKAIWLQFMREHERCDRSFALADDGLLRWEEMVLELMGRDDTFVFVAQSEQEILGFCLGWTARNPNIYKVVEIGFLSELAVTPQARRKGVGRRLMQQARAWFGRQGLQQFQLSTAVWNDEAQKFWTALGGRPLLVRYSFEV